MEWIIYATAIAAALMVGSFLNVVIHRGPAMWGLSDDEPSARGALWGPRSYCPKCQAPIGVRDLMPLLSYALLRGRCRSCGQAIALRYPIVEFGAAAAAAACLAVYGLTFSALFAAIFLMTLIALAAIDAETGFLPDALTLPLIWLGLIANLPGRFVPLEAAVLGAIIGYGVFRLAAELYRLVRGREGLGGGDAKLLAAIGAWVGWAALAPAVFVGATTAIVVILGSSLAGRKLGAETPVPFGPALCLGGAVALLASGLGGRDLPWIF